MNANRVCFKQNNTKSSFCDHTAAFFGWSSAILRHIFCIFWLHLTDTVRGGIIGSVTSVTFLIMETISFCRRGTVVGALRVTTQFSHDKKRLLVAVCFIVFVGVAWMQMLCIENVHMADSGKVLQNGPVLTQLTATVGTQACNSDQQSFCPKRKYLIRVGGAFCRCARISVTRRLKGNGSVFLSRTENHLFGAKKSRFSKRGHKVMNQKNVTTTVGVTFLAKIQKPHKKNNSVAVVGMSQFVNSPTNQRRSVTDADTACSDLAGLLRSGVGRSRFCEMLLLPRHMPVMASLGWRAGWKISGPVSLRMLHQQIVQSDASASISHRIWILLGEIHTMDTLCPADDDLVMEVSEFVPRVASNSRGCSVDLMLEERTAAISGGAPQLRTEDSPMTLFNRFFSHCSNTPYATLARMVNPPPCFQYMTENNLRVTYIDPRYEVLVNHPPNRWQLEDGLIVGRLLMNLGNERDQPFPVMIEIINSPHIPIDQITGRRIRRLQFMLAKARVTPDTYWTTQAARQMLLVLADMLPVAIYMTPLLRSQLGFMDEPHKSRLLHAFRAHTWSRQLRWETYWLPRAFRKYLNGLPLSAEKVEMFITSLLSDTVDMYTISRSMRRWNETKTTGADPHTACVVIVYAGDHHAKTIARVLPSMNPTDMLYCIASSTDPHGKAQQCVSLTADAVCALSNESVGSLRYYANIAHSTPVAPLT